jgi:hypothetical protein
MISTIPVAFIDEADVIRKLTGGPQHFCANTQLDEFGFNDLALSRQRGRPARC